MADTACTRESAYTPYSSVGSVNLIQASGIRQQEGRSADRSLKIQCFQIIYMAQFSKAIGLFGSSKLNLS